MINYGIIDGVVIVNNRVVLDIKPSDIHESFPEILYGFLRDFHEEIKGRVDVELSDLTVHRNLSEPLTFYIGWQGIPFPQRDSHLDLDCLLDDLRAEEEAVAD